MLPYKTVDEYIRAQTPKAQSLLSVLRNLVRKTVPDAVESLSYAMPAYKYRGRPLIYFAAFEHHIGVYATPSANTAFSHKLAQYKQGKGSIQFPIDEPLPVALIREMIQYKVKEITETDKK